MTPQQLATQLAKALAPRASALGLDRGPLQARYMLNPGGFVTSNFTVTDGHGRVHVKLASDPDGRADLDRWVGVADLLATRYRAPRLLDTVAFGNHAGVVLESLPGEAAVEGVPAAIVDEVLGLSYALHRDRHLASLLGAPRPLRDSFLGYFVEICSTDLDELTASGRMPPFVDEQTAAWMRAEVEQLRDTCLRSPAFDGEAHTPIHGDLWPGNILLGREGGWWIVDWDNLGIGDSVLDLALLTFTPLDQGESLSRWFYAADEQFMARLQLSLRGTLLIGVVDSLADWVEAERAPEHTAAVRAQKERDHRWCLNRYRERYG